MKYIPFLILLFNISHKNQNFYVGEPLYNNDLIFFISKTDSGFYYYITSYHNLKLTFKNDSNKIARIISWKDTLEYRLNDNLFLMRIEPKVNTYNYDSLLENKNSVIIPSSCLEYETIFFDLYKRGYIAEYTFSNCSVRFTKKSF